jgi:23S rRNA (cytidine1920-2'-O)/16S rRNA (cytidine1409-2'-O)-methyltransferase
MAKKERLDQLLVEKNFAADLEQSQRLILAGAVLVNDTPVDKVGTRVDRASDIRVRHQSPYVSRAGEKLAAALHHFHIEPHGYVVLDIGASTGGFTDCILQRGAQHVYTIDVGTNQLAWSLRNDARVTVFEETHARTLSKHISEFAALPPNFITLDVSFIALTDLLPHIIPLFPRAQYLALVKPHFELPADQVEVGGVVRSPDAHREACTLVSTCFEKSGFKTSPPFASPVPGKKGGNIEFFILAQP